MERPVLAAADLRLARAAVFAAVCVLLSALGHGVASGMPVGAGTLSAAWLAVMCVVVPLAGRRRSLPGITLGLAVGQVVLHVMFCLAQGTSGSTGRTGPAVPGASGVMALAARLVCGGLPAGTDPQDASRLVARAGLAPVRAAGALGSDSLPGMGAGGSSAMGGMQMGIVPTPGMALAHLVAALLLGLVLWRGEAALWRLVRGSGRTLAPLLGAVRAAVRAARAALAALATRAGLEENERGAATRARRRRTGPRPPSPVAVRHSVVRRGPPAAVPAA